MKLGGRNIYDLLGMKPGVTKFIDRRSITFRESCQGKKSKDMWMKVLDTMAKKTQFEVEFPTMDNSSSSEGTITRISDYHYTHDKERRGL